MALLPKFMRNDDDETPEQRAKRKKDLRDALEKAATDAERRRLQKEMNDKYGTLNDKDHKK